MISISHWGMFPTPLPRPFIPAGFKIKDIAEFKRQWLRPDGFIEVVPLGRGELQPFYLSPEIVD